MFLSIKEGLRVVLNTIILDYVLIEKYRLIKDGIYALLVVCAFRMLHK